jgi:nucleoredoxin
MNTKNDPQPMTQEGQENLEAPTVSTSYFGQTFASKSGEKTPEDFKAHNIICLYFAARSSPPCRIFTQVLLNFYREVNMIHKVIEIIYLPRDLNLEDYQAYLSQMPWIAIPHGEQRITDFKKKYNIQGIPSLVVLGSKGELISLDGRREIIQKGEQAFDAWMDKYNEVKLPDDDKEGGLYKIDEEEHNGAF